MSVNIVEPWEHPGELVPRLVESIGPFNLLLDVGGGGGTVGKPLWKCPIHVIDIYPPETIPSNFTLGNALDIVQIYGEKSFDIVLACEVIEHLSREDGLVLLDRLEQVARKCIVITTPNGFDAQDPANFPNEKWAKNPYQKHISGWLPEDFMSRGYTTYFNGGAVAAQIIAVKKLP